MSELKGPDGNTLMHGKRPYDPVKARAYYLRTRQLKGRKKGVAKDPNQERYRQSLDKFLKSLPMAVEGADLKAVEKFVDTMRTKTDAELQAEMAKIRREKGDNDGAQVATIQALLTNRNKVRSKKADSKRVAQKNVTQKKQRKLTKAG